MASPLIVSHFRLAYTKIFQQAGETFTYVPVGTSESFTIQGVRALLPPASAGGPAKRINGRIFQITVLSDQFHHLSPSLPQEGDTLRDESGAAFQAVSAQGHFRYEFSDPAKIGMKITVMEL